MAQEARLNLRMQRELKLLLTDPPHGASFPSLTSSSSLSSIHALIEGPEETVYAKGLFNLKIQIPERYPFQPPIVTFLTPIYHPNIDNGGRICLDTLNLPPKGAWQPSLNISTVLTSIGLLLSEPNPDDGLMHDASTEYKYNRQAFDHKARSMTQKYATAGASDFGGHDQEIQTLTNTGEEIVEVKELNLPKSEVPDHFVNQKGCGLSRKLSLDSAGRAQRHNGEIVSEVAIDHILNKQMEVSKQGMKELPIECDLNKDKVEQRTKKISSEIVSPSKVRNGEKKDYMAKTQCSASLEPQSIFLNYADIQALPQSVRSSGKAANPHNSEMRNISINKSANELLLKSTNFTQKHEDLEKLQFKPKLSVQLQSTASCQTLSLSGTPGHYNKRPHKKASDQNGNGFSTRHKNLGLTGRRHPFNTSSSSQHQKCDKENLAPSHNLPISESDACTDSSSSLFFTSQIGDTCDAWTRKSSNQCGTFKKLPLQAVEPSGEGKENNFQLTSQSGQHSEAQVNHPRSCENLCDQKQPNQDEDDYYNKNMKQQEKESPICEAVIVLDSEDSDDERSLHKRSKLSLARRHVSGKRKG